MIKELFETHFYILSELPFLGMHGTRVAGFGARGAIVASI